MCIKLFFGNLNLNICLLHFINTYTCRVTTTPRMHSDQTWCELNLLCCGLVFNIFICVYIYIYIYMKMFLSELTCFDSINKLVNFVLTRLNHNQPKMNLFIIHVKIESHILTWTHLVYINKCHFYVKQILLLNIELSS